MGKLKELSLNSVQLSNLLSEEEKDTYEFLLQQGVYCTSCRSICKEGVEVTSVTLNWLNDVVVNGRCKVCEQKISCVMEFGENQNFFIKAMEFRSSVGN